MNKRSSFYKRDSHVQMFMFNVIMSEKKVLHVAHGPHIHISLFQKLKS